MGLMGKHQGGRSIKRNDLPIDDGVIALCGEGLA